MTPQPLRIRVLTALELQPMTATELSRCLMARRTYIQRVLADLRQCCAVRYAGRQRIGNYRPHQMFEVRQ